MRVLLIACFAVLALSVQSAPNRPLNNDLFARLIKRTFSSRDDFTDLLWKAMEKFRKLMISGDPALDLPPMDPYVMDHREISLDLDILTGHASVDNMVLTGMSTYVLASVGGEDNGNTLVATFDMTVPKVDCVAEKYVLDAMVAGKYHIFGNGVLNVSAGQLRLQGSADGAISADQHLTVTKIDLTITVKEIMSAITGLMGNDADGKLANEIISEFGPGIVEDYGHQLGNFFAEIVRGIINKKIENLTVDQIIDMINSP